MLAIKSPNLLASRLSRHGPLSEGADDALQRVPATKRNYEAGDYIIREADTPSGCALLMSGIAYRQKITGSGARQIVALCLPGEVADLQNLYFHIADHNVQMLTEGEILSFSRQAIHDLAQKFPEIARAIFLETAYDAAIMREWLTNTGKRSAKARLAHLFCELAIRFSGPISTTSAQFEVTLNQELMGDMVGLTSAHVNRTIRDLSQAGLVIWSRQSVTLPDWKAIRAVGDFNGRYLHMNQIQPVIA